VNGNDLDPALAVEGKHSGVCVVDEAVGDGAKYVPPLPQCQALTSVHPHLINQ
jgi:hypothetical protein